MNEGQNIGLVSDFSGTMGAAKWAGRSGVPALATSQGQIGSGPWNYADGVTHVMDWITGNRGDIESGAFAGVPYPQVWSMNVPPCDPLAVRGVETVPLNPAVFNNAPDCASTLVGPADDVEAFANGFVSIAAIDPTPAP